MDLKIRVLLEIGQVAGRGSRCRDWWIKHKNHLLIILIIYLSLLKQTLSNEATHLHTQTTHVRDLLFKSKRFICPRIADLCSFTSA